jgi:hypothetical protein
MSDPRPSIAELKAQHEAMTAGRWESEVDGDQQANIFSREHWIALLPNRSLRANEANHMLDAAGICALHAAAPALLEIATAALAWKNANAVYDCKAQDATSQHLFSLLEKVLP